MANISPRLSYADPTLPPPLWDEDEVRHRRLIAEAIAQILDGNLALTKDVTLTANVASTTVTDKRIGRNRALLLMPTTANAAGALATTYIPTATITDGAAVIQHANNAQTDRTFRLLILGQ